MNIENKKILLLTICHLAGGVRLGLTSQTFCGYSYNLPLAEIL